MTSQKTPDEEIPMWHLKLKGGVELSEQHVRCWDNVPPDVEIESMALVFQRNGAAPFVIDLRGYDAYCIARVANASAGAAGSSIGYAVSLRKDGQVQEVMIVPGGMRVSSFELTKYKLPERCWRRGVA